MNSSSSARTPKLLLAAEQPSTGGCWNPPKKDTPCPKTKKKPQSDGRRGAIMIKSNPIPAKWMTHKLENNNTKEVLPLLWRLWAPHQASQTGGLAKGLGILGIWLWRPAGIDHKTATEQGETETPLLEDTNKISGAHHDPGGRCRGLNQTYLWLLEGLLQRCGLAVAHRGDRDTGSSSPGRGPLEGAINPTIEPVAPRAGLPQAKKLKGRDWNPTH